MKNLKYLLLFIFFCIFLSIISSYIISPRIKIINHKKYDIKLFKGESNANSIEPTLEEVERMLNSTVVIKPKKSYYFGIRKEYLLSNNTSRVNISLRNANSVNEQSSEYSTEFSIDENGFCKYTIEIYNDYVDIKKNSFNFFYKKLSIVK